MELPPQSTVTDDDVLSIDIYQDCIAFLKRIEEKQIKLTTTGNISLSDIAVLLTQLKTTKNIIDEHAKYNWKIHSESSLQTLTQIKIILLLMHLVGKRKGYLYLTKKGKLFLYQLMPLRRYEQIVLTYWNICNWDYFSHYSAPVGYYSFSEILQDIHNQLWKLFLQKRIAWIDYPSFCKSMRDYFHLNEYLKDPYTRADQEVRFMDIEYDLFRRNLILFGCIEIEEKHGKQSYDTRIIRFRATPIGLYLFEKDGRNDSQTDWQN